MKDAILPLMVMCETDCNEYEMQSDLIVLCKTDSNYYLKTDDNLVQIGDFFYLLDDDDIVQCASDDSWYLKSDLVLCKTDDLYYLKDDDDICCVEDEYYRKDDDDICFNESIDEYDFRDNCSWCEDCGNYYSCDDITYVGDYGYCERCLTRNFWYCSGCSEYFSNNDSSFEVIDGHGVYCESCIEDFSYREDCGNYYRNDCNCEHNRFISHYHSHPTLKFHRLEIEKKRITYLGIELETENKNADSSGLESIAEKVITDSNNFFYCETDGSLSNGFEIISHPFSLQYYRRHKSLFNTMLHNLRHNGCRSFESGSCGLHIHVSKASFSSLDIYKMLRFFNNNSNFIDVISQRNGKNITYCRKQDNNKEFVKIAKNKYNSERYVQINLTNDKTIEFRIFRGTLFQESFLKSLEFVFAFIEFVKVCSIQELTSDCFKTFIEKRPKTYKNLISFINKKGI